MASNSHYNLLKLLLSSLIIVLTINSNTNAAYCAKPKLRGKATITHKTNKTIEKLNYYINSGHYNEASALVDDIQTTSEQLKYLKAKLCLKTGELDKGKELALKLLKKNPHDYEALMIMGEIYLQKSTETDDSKLFWGNLKKSFVFFNAANEFNPNNPSPLLGLSRVYSARGEKEKALNKLFGARDLDRENPDTFFYLGEFYFSNAKFIQAQKYLEKSNEFRGYDCHDTHLLLAQTYEKLGDVDNAIKNYKIVFKIKPQNLEISDKIKSLESL